MLCQGELKAKVEQWKDSSQVKVAQWKDTPQVKVWIGPLYKQMYAHLSATEITFFVQVGLHFENYTDQQLQQKSYDTGRQ